MSANDEDDLFADFAAVSNQLTPDEQWCEEQAWFCSITKMSPSEYKLLDRNEINAFIKVYNEIAKRQSKGK